MTTTLVAALVALTLSAGPGPADRHLLAGAAAFREGRFDESLVEFRVAEKLGAADASSYAGAALLKLGRPEDALEAFGPAAGPTGDPLLDHYRAMACYEARLFGCADRFLAGVAAQGGPGIADQAARTRAAIAAVLRDEPSTGTIDWYLARCTPAQPPRPRLAAAYCEEAIGLASRRKDAHGKAPAQEALARVRRTGSGR